MSDSPLPPVDDAFVDQLLSHPESRTFECKRIGKVDKPLESVVAFANSDGGILVLGLEDPDKGKGRERVHGIQTHPMNWDELQRKLRSRITEPDQLPIAHQEVGCTLQDGSRGSLIVLRIQKSSRVHSIVDNGTFVRLSKGNKELTANEINDLCHARGVVSAETRLEDVDFELLETDYWRAYSRQRKLTRPVDEAMHHLGLARRDEHGRLRPTRAAVLLFAEDPSGVLAAKAAIRVFHYHGTETTTAPNTNLIRRPVTVSGPLIRQIVDARQVVIDELAEKVQYGPFGFEIVQRYPVRVIAEAITNAVIHRDYRLTADVAIRIFSDRIEVESPGLLPGTVTVANIQHVRHNRNPLIVQHLREFPDPPNLDAHEGVKMMFGTMQEAGLYPPRFVTRPTIPREAVVVRLRNQNQPSAWQQVSHYVDEHGSVSNAQVREILGTDDRIRASRQLREWVELGMLVVANPQSAKKHRRYTKPDLDPGFGLFADLIGK